MAKKEAGPDSTSSSYEAMLPVWTKIESLLGGTESMRAAGHQYLPQHDEESDGAWAERKDRATLLNMLQMTLDSWVGKPFSDPVQFKEDVPEQLKALTDNLDLMGNNTDVFARNWFRDGLAKGLSHVLAEFPKPTPRADGQPRTLADDRADALRPYLVHIKPENLTFAHAVYVNGVEVLQQVRIRECITEIVGWEEVQHVQYRVLTPGHVEIWRLVKLPTSKKEVWRKYDEWDTSLNFIPLATFYAERSGFMFSKPPLADLADLNVRHWQSTSDQIAILTVARFPMLGVSGAISEDDIHVGPHSWLHCPDPAGRFYYVEHTGKAIGAGRQDLLDLEETMAEYGATFLKKRPGGASATARALDTAEVTSPLQDMALRFQSALQQAFDYLGAWIGLKPEQTGTVAINVDFGLDHGNDTMLAEAREARKSGDLSRSAYLGVLKRMGVLDDSFDASKNDTELETERKAKEQQELDKQDKTLALQAKHRPEPTTTPAPAGGAAK